MKKEGFELFFRSEIDEFEEIVAKSRITRPFVEHDPESELLDSYVSAIHTLIQKSESVSNLLIDDFLETKTVDPALVDKAKTLISQAKDEIARFREQRDFAALDISDETDKLQ